MPGLEERRGKIEAFDPSSFPSGSARTIRLHPEHQIPPVSAIIPTLDGMRDGNLKRLLGDLEKQDFEAFEIIVVKGVKPQGKAINMGADLARGALLIILDDDSRMPNAGTFSNLVRVCRADARIGMAGASVVISPESNAFQQRAARQFPRFNMPVVSEVTESDMASHGCCAIPRQLFFDIGKEKENIVRGLDPDLRVRLRAAGYKTVLVPGTFIYHPLAPTLPKLMKLFYRNGKGSAYALVHDPENVYDTADKATMEGFVARSSFAWRVLRFPLRLLRAMATLRGIRCAAYSAYAVGFASGLLQHGFAKGKKTAPAC